jgi:hypothetical protein
LNKTSDEVVNELLKKDKLQFDFWKEMEGENIHINFLQILLHTFV